MPKYSNKNSRKDLKKSEIYRQAVVVIKKKVAAVKNKKDQKRLNKAVDYLKEKQ